MIRDVYTVYVCITCKEQIQGKKSLVCAGATVLPTPKLEAAKRSEADTLVEAVVWA